MNELTFNIFALIFITHFIADFVCQTDMMAQNKSSSIYWLSVHVTVYTLVMSLVFPWQFALLNGVLHWSVDFCTSKATKKLWQMKQVHYFFVVIGLDQLLHNLCLVYTYLNFETIKLTLGF